MRAALGMPAAHIQCLSSAHQASGDRLGVSAFSQTVVHRGGLAQP